VGLAAKGVPINKPRGDFFPKPLLIRVQKVTGRDRKGRSHFNVLKSGKGTGREK